MNKLNEQHLSAFLSYQEAVLWPQPVVRDLWLGGQVGRRVVVGRDELGVLILMELIGSRLQNALLQFDAPLELHVPEGAERHEQAQQPVLMQRKTERGRSSD